MPSKRKKFEISPGVAGVTIPPELLDHLVKGPMTPEEVQAACLSFKKALIQRALGQRDGDGMAGGASHACPASTALAPARGMDCGQCLELLLNR